MLALVASVSYLAIWNESRTEYVAAAIVAVPYWLAFIRQSRRKWRAVSASALLTLAAATAAYSSGLFAISASARAELWLNTIASWLHAPLFGHGIGGFEAAYGLTRKTHQHWFPWLDTIMTVPTVFAGAAHNEFLQALQQFGVYGAGLLAFFGWTMLRHRGPLAAQIAILAATGCALVGFPAQNPATAIVIAVALGLLTGGAPRQDYRFPRIAAIGLSLCAVAASAWISWVGVHSYAAAQHMAAFQRYATWNALKAFEHNYEAYEVFPLNAENRRQLAPSLARVMQTYKNNLDLDPNAADRVFGIALTAGGYDVAALTMRAEYLINVGRADAPEMRELVRRLVVSAGAIPSTWLIKAHWHRGIGEPTEARLAAEHGLTIGLRNPILDAQLRAILTENAQ